MPKPNNPKKVYPNSGRFAGDGRRLYSAYEAGKTTKAAEAAKSAFIEAAIKGKKPIPSVKLRRRSMLMVAPHSSAFWAF